MPRLQDHYTQFVIFVVLFATVTVVGFAASRWRRPATLASLDEWGLGGRSFGSWATWFLLGGDLYTAYTFVALPALMFGAGAIGFFAVPYTVMGYPLLFLPLLRLWSVSHAHGFVTTADFVRARFASPTLALLVALTGIVATIPYVALNMVGIEAVFKTMGLTGRWPVTFAFLVLAIYTYQAGLRAPALIALVKDALVCFTIVAAILVLPFAQGGWGNVFHRTAVRFNESGSVAGLLLNSNQHLNFITLAIGSALGTFMYPHAMTGLLAARSRTTVKHNMIALPVFSILLGMLCLLGYIALTEDVRPVGADAAHGKVGDLNTVVPRLFDQIGPPWFAGVAFATIGIAALVPAAIMAIGAANLFARNVYREFIHPNASAAEEARVSRLVSLLVKFGAVSLVLFLDPQFSIDMQLIGGVVVMQVVPAVLLGLYTRWLHRWGLVAGLIAGLIAGIVMVYQIPQRGGPHGATIIRPHWGGSSYPLWHFGFDTQATVYAGFAAFLINLVVTVAATVVLRVVGASAGHDRTRPEDYTADVGDPRLDKLPELLDDEVAVAARFG